MLPSAPARTRFAIGLLGLSSLITGLDFTIVYVALPDIDRELGFSGGQVQWVVSAYALTFGGFLLLFGRLSDLLGRRRIFLFGMLLFAAASLLGTFGNTPAVLLVARALQGVGAAALFPSTLSLVTSTFPEGPARGRAMTVWAASGASGLSLGALLGGILTAIDWRSVFLVNVPLTALAAVGAVLVLAPDTGRIGRGGFDPIGAITGTTAATLFVLAVSQLPEPGVSLTSVLITGLAAAVLAGVFLRTEATARAPMLPLSLFAHRGLRVAMVVISAFGITLQSIPYLLTIHFRSGLDLTALQAGLAFLLPTGAITIGNLAGERLLARYGPRVVLTTGLVIGATGAPCSSRLSRPVPAISPWLPASPWPASAWAWCSPPCSPLRPPASLQSTAASPPVSLERAPVRHRDRPRRRQWAPRSPGSRPHSRACRHRDRRPCRDRSRPARSAGCGEGTALEQRDLADIHQRWPGTTIAWPGPWWRSA